MSMWSQFGADFASKKVLVFGLGLQGGVQVANTLCQAGAVVRVSDAKSADQLQSAIESLEPGISTTFGEHPVEDINWADIIIKNPGVPFEHPLIQQALAQGKTVVGETALALQYTRDRSIAITGTRGKTTTSTLIHHLLQTAELPSVLAGNIPNAPLLAQLPHLTPDTWAVVEISSFQLESLPDTQTSAHLAVITSLYPDHLNRYPDWNAYVAAKLNLFRYQQPGDVAVYLTERPWSAQVAAAQAPEVTVQAVSPFALSQIRQEFSSSLPGEHNWDNISLAVTVARQVGVTDEAIQAGLDSFTGVPYRLETVATKQGVTYVNDTTSTTPISLEKALDTYVDQRFILIAGGKTKLLPLSESLMEKVAARPIGVILLKGSGQAEIQEALRQLDLTLPHLTIVDSLPKAIEIAHSQAQQFQAQVVLFSPGFSSFDLFTNEFERGNQFNQLVHQLPE